MKHLAILTAAALMAGPAFAAPEKEDARQATCLTGNPVIEVLPGLSDETCSVRPDDGLALLLWNEMDGEDVVPSDVRPPAAA